MMNLHSNRREHISSRTFAVLLVLLLMLTAGVYAKSITNDFVTWDDDTLITVNPAVHEISTLSFRWVFTHYDPELYIPLTFLTYQVDWWMGNGSPIPFHVGNLFFHLVNVLLFSLLTQKLTGNRWISLYAGALFALHPINTEAVVWASARKDVLSACFFLLSLAFYLSYRQRQSTVQYIISIGMFTLGLLAKVSILLLPGVLLLLDVWQGRKITKLCTYEKIPYICLSLIFGIIAVFGKRDMFVATTLSQKLLMASKSSVFMLQKLLFPFDLSVLYPYTKTITVFSVDFALPVIMCVILVLIVAASLRLTKSIAIAACFSALMLLPSLTNFAKGQGIYIFSDRYAYLPALSIYLLVAALLSLAKPRVLSIIGMSSFCVLLGLFSFRQALTWQSTETLMRNVLTIYPHSYVAQNNLGVALFQSGKETEAEIAFHEALAKKPDYADALNNLGVLQWKHEDITGAITSFEAALRHNPHHSKARQNLQQIRKNL